MKSISNLKNSIINWVKKPYYYNNSNTFKIKASFGIGLLVFILLVLFRPVNIKIITVNPYLFKLGIALITIFNLLLFFFVIEKKFKKFFKNENWTVGKHFITIISVITFSSVLRWLYFYLLFPLELEHNNMTLPKMMVNSFVVGFFLVLTFIYFDEKHQSKKYSINKDELKKKKSTTIKKIPKLNKSITLFSSNQKESVTFLLNDLIYIYSEANYACIILKKKEENNFKEEILRIPLHMIEKKLENYNQILRCHKSYIVNTDYVNHISGNARGYSLHLKNNIKQIPVSRRFTKEQLQNVV